MGGGEMEPDERLISNSSACLTIGNACSGSIIVLRSANPRRRAHFLKSRWPAPSHRSWLASAPHRPRSASQPCPPQKLRLHPPATASSSPRSGWGEHQTAGASSVSVLSLFKAARASFALRIAVWIVRGRRDIVLLVFRHRNGCQRTIVSTHPDVRISETGSTVAAVPLFLANLSPSAVNGPKQPSTTEAQDETTGCPQRDFLARCLHVFLLNRQVEGEHLRRQVAGPSHHYLHGRGSRRGRRCGWRGRHRRSAAAGRYRSHAGEEQQQHQHVASAG